MNHFEQIYAMKQALTDDLRDVINNHMTDIGGSMTEGDVIGILEQVKLEYFFSGMFTSEEG